MHRPFQALIFVLGGCSMLFACQPELAMNAQDKRAVPLRLIESAREWHSAHRDANARDTILPYWDQAWTMTTAGGDRVLVAPGPGMPIMNPHFSFSRFFIFYTEKRVIREGRIVEFLGKDYNVKSNTGYLLENYNQPVISGFNGSVIQYDMNHRQVEDATYQNGYKNSNIRTGFATISGKYIDSLTRPVRTAEELKAGMKKRQAEEKTP